MSIHLIGHNIKQVLFLCDESLGMLIKIFVTLSYVRSLFKPMMTQLAV